MLKTGLSKCIRIMKSTPKSKKKKKETAKFRNKFETDRLGMILN